MKQISVRQQRLLKMWAMNFAIYFGSAVAIFATMIGTGVGLIMLGKAYGPGIVLGLILVGMAVIICATFGYASAKEKLAKLEREEERTMDALRKDHTHNDDDYLFNSVRAQINKMKTDFHTNKKY